MSGVTALLELVLAVLRERGHDFRDYRHEVLSRRLIERMTVIGADDGDAYVRRLASDDGELAALVDTLLISTSQLFRDPDMFAALEARVIPALLGQARGRVLRTWVAGVATGEEAWTIAMLIDRAAASPAAPYEVFASDINLGALAVARAGVYEAAEATAVPRAYRDAYLDEQRGLVRVSDGLRPRVIFCEHDLLGASMAPAEAVLARFDLVLCRNVLIYLDPRLQTRLVARLTGMMAPGAVLGLGPVEVLPEEFGRVLSPYPGLDRRLNLFVREDER